MATIKSPTGLRPTNIWLQDRIEEIAEAVQRYMEARKTVPQDWMDEYYAHLKELDSLQSVCTPKDENRATDKPTWMIPQEMAKKELTQKIRLVDGEYVEASEPLLVNLEADDEGVYLYGRIIILGPSTRKLCVYSADFYLVDPASQPTKVRFLTVGEQAEFEEKLLTAKVNEK